MKTILFQGDSITDCGRNRENKRVGGGYPLLATSVLECDFPGEYNIYNTGISGNRIVDLYARIKADLINLKPDYMSILIGVNDVWHELGANKNGVSAEKYERIYDMLLSEVKAELPDLRIVIMEPYVVHGTGTDTYYDEFRREVELRAAAARRLAEKYGCVFIPLQSMFDEVIAKSGDPAHWTHDGVHPNHAGHQLIARAWLDAFGKIK